MKRIIFIHIISMFLVLGGYAQQKPTSTQYVFDKYFINPAYVGTSNFVTASVNVKQYLTGIAGAPSTQYFMAQYPIQSEFMGIGVKLMHDKIGVATQTNALFTYAYQIGLAGGTLSMAIDGGVYNTRADFSVLKPVDDAYDAAIPEDAAAILSPDASFGMYYKLSHFYLGYAAFNLLGGKTNYASTDYSGQELLSNYHYIMSGYEIKVSKLLSFEPLLLMRYAQASPPQFDVQCAVQYAKVLQGSLLYTTGRGMSAMVCVGLKEGQYKIGYSYDVSLPNNRASFLNGGHEFMFIYSLELTPPASQKDFNPIFYVN